MSQLPTQRPRERAGSFMMFTGIMCAVLLALNLLPTVMTTPEQFVQVFVEAAQENPMSLGGPMPFGVRGANLFLSVWAIVVSGLIVAAVVLAVSGYRLRNGNPRALRSGAIAVGFLLFAFAAVGLLGLITVILAPATAFVALLLAGPAVLLGWLVALMVKAREDLLPEPPLENVRPATFYVPIGTGELPGPG